MHARVVSIVSVVSMLLCQRGSADAPLPLNRADTGTPAQFEAIRYLEDYSALAHAAELAADDRIKYLPLWSGAYLSLGGQHRLRYQWLEAERLGRQRVTTSVLLSRNLVHLDLHLAPSLRIFAQLGGFYALGLPDRTAAPPAADELDVTQLFIEAKAELSGIQITSRIGRQEMALGSTRWVSTRDGTNVRQAFDLIRVSLDQPHGWSMENFFGTTPELQRGRFDDAPNFREAFWGNYTKFTWVPELLQVELFYLGRARAEAHYAEVTGRELRHTVGLRVFGTTPFGTQYIQHALLQLGRFEHAPVLAWGFASGLWQQLPAALSSLRIGVRADALSGDAHPGRGRVRTFHPLFPNQSFFSALPAIYPANLYDIHPLVRYEHHELALEAGCVFFWRQAVADTLFEPPGQAVFSGVQTRARYTGAQLSISLAYQSDRHLSFNAEYSHIFAGPAITSAGGRDVDFFGSWATYTY